MNEVRQAWTSLRSPSKVSNPIADTRSTATWYDLPAPVIVHCREFQDDVAGIENEKIHARVKDKVEKESDVVGNNDTRNSCEIIDGREEVLYQNNVEAALNSLSKVCAHAPKVEMDLEDAKNIRDTVATSTKKRHSTTVELKATTSVSTDREGLPTISFSFLQEDEKVYTSALEKNVETESKNRLRDSENQAQNQDQNEDQLYDFPRNSRVGAESNDDNTSSPNEKKIVDDSGQVLESRTSEDPEEVGSELYDVPKAAKAAKDRSSMSVLRIDGENSEKTDSPKPPGNFVTIIELPRKKDRQEDIKRSTRSLKSTRRSCEATESEGDAGIASMSGSYSDPECQNDGLSSNSRRSRHPKLRKRRLGKAWSKMRSWLREEKSRIGEVVNRHARMQAVGALSSDRHSEDAPRAYRGKSASYDLTKARTQELGSITRVEEFGLTSVSEEGNVSETDGRSSKSPDSGKASTKEHRELDDETSYRGRRLPRSKTASTDDILASANETRLPPVSFSMDKLCVDGDNEEPGNSSNDADDTRDRSGKAGPIGKRMLGSIRGLMASTHLLQTHDTEEAGQGGFEDVRRYVKQGGDFCKELAAILHERAELEATYAKGLSKLSSKLTKACSKDQGGNSTGGVNEAWRCVGEEMEAAAEAHRVWGIALGEQLAKPLRVGVAEAQGRSRKSIENSVDKASKSLQEWRGVAAKSKKQSFACARENERLQDLARLQSISSQTQQNNNKSSSHHMTEKEASKLEARRRKAEDSSRRADTEFYTVSVRAERARLEYESTVRKGAKQMELLEEERLSALKDLANVYLAHLQALAPRLQQSADRLAPSIRNCNVSQDVDILKNVIRRMDSNDVTNAEQLLPDFYAEHVTLAMNRERRKQALVRVLHLIRQDLDREKRGREGLETLHKAFITTPAFAADESTQNVTDKLHHMRSMLLYLEAARYKVGGTLAEVEGSKRGKHPLAEHILVSRDKQGLQQSVLKIPSWVKNESLEFQDGESELELQLTKDHESENRDWADRTAGDGNSENPPDEDDFSDFDEFSSQSEDNNNQDVDVTDVVTSKSEGTEQCRAIYQYSANLNDELSLNPGDLITVHQKQADGWWIGECRGRTGIFPATYVQVIH